MVTARIHRTGTDECGGHEDRSRFGRRALMALAIVAVAAGLAACSSPSSHATSTSVPTSAGTGGSGTGGSSIAIKNFAFAPDVLTVTPGATVSVKNEDGVTHTLSSTTGKFSTGDVASGHTVTFTAPETPGTYPYRCNIHQYMT